MTATVPTDNRYTRASKIYNQWLDQGVLTEDLQPAFYVYEQRFEVKGAQGLQQHTRRGVMVALKLEPFGEGCVYPHEETFPSHKTDRLNLMRACRANFSSIFGLVPDTDKSIHDQLASVVQGKEPTMHVKEEQGVEKSVVGH